MKQIIARYTLISLLSVFGYTTLSGQGTLVDFNTIPKTGTALIYAHMDDDLIWMLPFWKITDKFYGGAMPATPTFRTIIDQTQSYLNANSYPINYKANWFVPWDEITHTEYAEYYWDHNEDYNYLENDHLLYSGKYTSDAIIRNEVNKTKAKLEQYLANPNTARIITHNNWGEYGHGHHKVVNKAVRELAVKYRKDVWMLGCNNGNFVDVDVPNGITYTMGNYDDPDLYSAVRGIYEDNYCWTWYDDIPTGSHKYIKIVDAGIDKSDLLTGEAVTASGPAQDIPGAYIFDGTDDYMTLTGKSNASFTIAMSVRPDVIRSMDVSKMTEYPGNPVSDRNFYMNGNGTISARIFDGSDKVITSTTSLTADAWTHIAMVGNGSTLTIYVNGLPEGNVAAGGAVTSYTTPEFVMGQTGMTSAFFIGQIANVQIIDHALTASEIAALSGIKHTITSSAGPDGTITPAGAVVVLDGAHQTFEIAGNTGYQVSEVLVDGNPAGAITSYTFNNVRQDHTISATFIPGPTWTITASAGSGGSISPAGSLTVNQGSDQTFTITPNSGYRLSGLRVDGSTVETVSSYTFNDVTANHTIAATFTAIPSYTITPVAGSGGSISPSGSVSVQEGGGSTFTFIPGTGYRISNVLVDNVSQGVISSYTFENVTSNHTISVAFSIITFTIDASDSNGGTINPKGGVAVNYGSNRTFTITPNTGYAVSDVIVDDESMGAITSFTFSHISSDHSISATFSLIANAITATAGQGGTISPSGTVPVSYGSNQTFSISPNTGYHISDVRVDNSSVGAVTSYTFNNVTTTHTIAATFAINTFSITPSAGAGGSVSPSGATNVNYGSALTVTFTPDQGYHVADIMVDGVSVGAASSYTFTNVTSDHTVAASFSINNYTITVNSGTGGAISPAGSIGVDYGNDQNFTITPGYGYRISDVKVDNSSLGPVSSYTFTSVTANHTISATFALLTYSITSTADNGGSISPSGSNPVEHGSSKTFTIMPATGNKISDVKVDGVSVGPVTDYTFSNIQGDHSISASFELLTFTITGSAGDGGSISPAGGVTADYGTSLVFDITPGTGYNIAGVKVDDASIGVVSNYIFDNIDADHTISAEFVIQKFRITVNAGENGSIEPGDPGTADYGSSQTFHISASEGFKIADVLVDDNSVGAVSSYTFENITSNHSITANFEILDNYVIEAIAGKGGSISPVGSLSLPEQSSQTYDITPDKGFRILRVIVDNTDLGIISQYTFSDIGDNHKITAEFTTLTTVKVYPSPFIENFTLDVKSPLEDTFDLYVYDMASKLVYIQKGIDPISTTTVDAGQLSCGIYFVRLRYHDAVIKTIKVIKMSK